MASLMCKRIIMVLAAGGLLVACATKPKPIASTDAFSVQSVTVSSTVEDAQFKTVLNDTLADQFTGVGSGIASELNITITNVRYGGSFASTIYGAVNGATLNVIVRSTDTGLKLSDFRMRVTSNATDKFRARQQLAENALRKLKQIFRTRVKPEVVAKERKKALASAKRNAKPISLDPIGDLERTILNDEQLTIITPQDKPKLIPIAEARPEVDTPEVVEAPQTQVPADSTPKEPIATAKPVATPKSVIQSETTPQPAAKPEDVPTPVEKASDDESLCVVTLENDCSQSN